MSGSSKQDGGAARRSDATEGSEQLRRLKSGEASLDEYLDYRADIGVAHLKGLLDAEHFRVVRETIREQLANDPVLREWISRLTETGSAVLSGG